MITNIPTSDDFQRTGESYLNLAWNSALELCLEFDDIEIDKYDEDGAAAKVYWRAAQRRLATATSLLQQGVEFLLKSRIASVSPFLLFGAPAGKWPGESAAKDTPFAKFKTIDAQDLISAHNTVCNTRLDDIFTNEYENLRDLRNSIVHTVDNSLEFKPIDLLTQILFFSDQLIGPLKWTDVRSRSISEEPAAVAWRDEDHVASLAREVLYLLNNLTPADFKKYFGFDPRKHRYLCPDCHDAAADWGIEPKIAFLVPPAPETTLLKCTACGGTRNIERTDCQFEDCNGNVYDPDYGMCLSCGRG